MSFVFFWGSMSWNRRCILGFLILASIIYNDYLYAMDWTAGGYVKEKVWFFEPGKKDMISIINNSPGLESSTDLRITGRLFFSSRISLEAHYQLLFISGDRIERINKLKRLAPSVPDVLFPEQGDRNMSLLDLTKILDKGDTHTLLHKLDRINLTLISRDYSLIIGRHAVTWGHGFFFNPADIINPFPPEEIDREYKPGEDMVDLNIQTGEESGLEVLFVPRRDDATGDPSWNHSSLGIKLSLFPGEMDTDSFLIKHYRDIVIGGGMEGYLSGAAWRGDLIWTFLRGKGQRGNYISVNGNMDYSWTLWAKNFYGFLELYYNGLGGKDYGNTLLRPEIMERISRGEIFLLGRFYGGGNIQVEIHPLLNGFLNLLINLQDPSGLVQTYLIWDVLQDVRITIGTTIPFGRDGTEFGGYSISPGNITTEPDRTMYVWIGKYF